MTNELDQLVEKPLTFIRDKAPEYAKAKSDRVYLEQFRKSKKALLMIEAEQKGHKTVSERECYAYAHQDYIALLDGLRVAVEREEYLKTQIEAAKLKIDVFRTIAANERFERKAYGAN